MNNVELSGSHQDPPIQSDFYALPIFTEDDCFSPFLLETSCSPKTWNSLGLGTLTDNSHHFADMQSSNSSGWLDNFFTLGNIRSAGGVTPWPYDSTFATEPLLYCDPQNILLNTDLNVGNGSSMLGSKDNLHDNSRNPVGHYHVIRKGMFFEDMFLTDWDNPDDRETRNYHSEYVQPNLVGRNTALEFSFTGPSGNDRGWTSSAFSGPFCDLPLSSPQSSSAFPYPHHSVNDHPPGLVCGEASSGFGSSHRHSRHPKRISRPAALRQPREPGFVGPAHRNESLLQHPHSHHKSDGSGNVFQSWQTSSDCYLQSTPNEGHWHRLLFSSGDPAIRITSFFFSILLCAIFISGVFRSVLAHKALTPYDKAFRSLVRLRTTPIQAARDLYSAHALLRREEPVIREFSISQSGNFFTRFIELFTDPRKRRASQAAGIVCIGQLMCRSE